jgi:WD40 repeat protein
VARLGTVRFRHGSSGVDLVAFSGDGKRLVSASSNGMVRVWDPSTGKELRHFVIEVVSAINWIALAPDGRTVAAADVPGPERGNAIHLWDVMAGKPLRVLQGHTDTVRGMGFSADGKLLASGGGNQDKTIRVWDVATGRETHHFPGDLFRHHSLLTFSRDGKRLAWGDEDRAVHIWDLEQGKEVQKLAGCSSAAFSPDGRTVALGTHGTTVRLWDLTTGKDLHQLPGHTPAAGALTFSPDGALLATSSSDGIRLWDVATGKQLRRQEGTLGKGGTGPLAFSHDGRVLASGSGGALHLWDVATGRDLRAYPGHSSDVWSIAWSRDGRALLSAGEAIRLWEPLTGKELGKVTTSLRGISGLALAPDGKTLAAGSMNIFICDLTTRKELRQFSPESRFTLNVVLSPDGKFLASDGTEAIHLWDLATGTHLRQFGKPAHQLGSFSFSPDGKLLALADRDTVGLWDVSSGKEVHQLPAQQACSVAFSPDGRVLACGGQDGMVRLWDALSRKKLHEFRSHRWATCFVAFSPDSKTLAVGTWHQPAVGLWETATGQERHTFAGHRSGVLCVSFSPDGRYIASGSTDTTILVWDATGRTRESHQDGRKLTAKELEARWEDLGGDAARAYRAAATLLDTPGQTVPLLKQHLRPSVAPANAKQIGRMLRDLDSEDFPVRQMAVRELEAMGAAAEMPVRAALAAKPSAEVRVQLEQLLPRFEASLTESPARLQALRAIELLERIGTLEARDVLQTLAAGASGARLTHEARAALQRLTNRPTAP